MRETVEFFAFRAARETATMAATLEWLDGLVFTGEDAPEISAEYVADLRGPVSSPIRNGIAEAPNGSAATTIGERFGNPYERGIRHRAAQHKGERLPRR